MNDGPTLLQYVITTVIAVLALGLSVVALILQRLDKRPKLKIRGSYGVITTEPDPLYIFTVSNPRDRTVTLQNITVGIKGGQRLMFGSMRGENTLPTKLEHGDKSDFWVALDELRKELRKYGYSDPAQVTLQAHDALGNVYKKRTKIHLSNS